MKKVYVACRVSGDIERNLALARTYARFVVDEGHCPVVPHLTLCQILDDRVKEERRLGMALGEELLKVCDELWLFIDERGMSVGMQTEAGVAKQLGIPMKKVDGRQVCLRTTD